MIRILQGDCRAVLATLPDASVHCCVTSPPYWGLRAYLPDGHEDKANELGLEQSPDAHVAEMVAVFREVRRVLRADGTLWLNLGDSYAGQNAPGFRAGNEEKNGGASNKNGVGAVNGAKPKDLLMIPARVALALQADGWWLRSDIIWAKPNPMPESVTDRPTSAHEHVFLLTKNARYFFDAEAVKEPSLPESTKRQAAGFNGADRNNHYRPGYFVRDGFESSSRNLRNVWTIATHSFPDAHFATFPPELAETCIKAGTSERGCCPKCAAPWGRQVERTAMVIDRSERTHALGRTRSSGTMIEPPTSNTIGWLPSCSCNAGEPVPCTVLDPFAGAFTGPLVADRLQRHAIGIELSETYCDMARRRIEKDAGMFADIA